MASTPYSNLPIPQNYIDPYYTSSQDTLSKLGTDILSGKLPDFYSNLGKANSPAFQGMLQSVIGNTQRGVQEQAAQGGTARSGTVNAATSDALSQVIPSLTYQDFLNSQQQQGALLSLGTGITQGVGAAGQNQENIVDSQMQRIFEDALQQQNSIQGYKTNVAQAQGQMIGNIGNLLFGSNVGGSIGGIFGASPSNSQSNQGFGGLSQFLSSLNSGGGGVSGINGASGGTASGLSSQLGGFSNLFSPSTLASTEYLLAMAAI